METAQGFRDRAIGDFFRVLTDILLNCVPLIKAAMEREAKQLKERVH
jgi:hypothetical protein